MGKSRQRNLVLFCVLIGVAATIALATTKFTTLQSFSKMTGENPATVLVQGFSGNLFGTTIFGGPSDAGAVFKITTSGTLTTLYKFCSQNNCMDGISPVGDLAEGSDGNFYGTTELGGSSSSLGTIFKITPMGTLTTLHTFQGTEGASPRGGLVLGTDGNFYGTTALGGAGGRTCKAGEHLGCGVFFKITPGGSLTTLYSFCSESDCTDGAEPAHSLVQGADGNFYGTTRFQGAYGMGTIFRIAPAGVLTTLHSFDGTDGLDPEGSLVEYTNGDFYGTTYGGGTMGEGTVFKIDSNGDLTTLYNFCCTATGTGPRELVLGTDGNFYGATASGGANGGGGTIFKMSPGGTITTVYNFCSQPSCTDGSMPFAALFQDTNGSFDGTTYFGGAHGNGTVFNLRAGLGSFVRTLPIAGTAGASVNILGNNLSGATSVTFNGIAAAFTVVSNSYVTTTVPSGATTGTVQVVTPRGTLSSNVPFTVN